MAHLFQEHEGLHVAERDRPRSRRCSSCRCAVVESTVSFYTLFYRKPVGKYMLQVCRNLSCIINGAEEIMAYFRERLGIGHLETTADGLFSYEEVECLAACDRAAVHAGEPATSNTTSRPQMIDDMLGRDARRHVRRRAAGRRPKAPGRTWKVESTIDRPQIGRRRRRFESEQRRRRRRPQRRDHARPHRRTTSAFAARSHERLAHEPQLRPSTGDGGHH